MAPSTDWKEVVLPGEAERLKTLAEQFMSVQRKRPPNHSGRGLHLKAHGGLLGEFTVLPDLPEYARVGMFAKAQTYKAYVRFSNGMGSRQPDTKDDVRGIAVKVVGVEGKKVIPPLADAKTQDFLAILTSSLPFQNGEDFVWFVTTLRSSPALLLPKALFKFGPAKVARIVKLVAAARIAPPATVLTRNYFSGAPIKFGDYAVRYKFEAVPNEVANANANSGEKYLEEDLAQRLSTGAVRFSFQVQFFIDEKKTPIEDASIDWVDAPYVTVATLTLPKQDVKSPAGEALGKYVETLSFDPWHAQEELRPLGNMMRARNAAYLLSTSDRKAAPEPDGTEKY